MFINLILNFVKLISSVKDEAYYKYTRFNGMKGPINCLVFSHGGELLASGGDDETVRIWELSTKKCVQVLEDHGRRWGQITCLTWLRGLGSDELKPIAFGTGRGLLVIYRRSRIDAAFVELASTRAFEPSDPIESMAYNAKNCHLAVTSHHGRISLYDIGRNGTMVLLWTAPVDPDKKVCIPRSIRFQDGGKKVLIFVLETGEMICRDVESAREDWRKVLKSGIGTATICPTGKLLLVENLSTGFDLYDLPRSSPSYAFSVPTKKKCVKDGAFAEQASIVVCGSDHGKVYIFSTASPMPIQVLRLAGKTVDIQAVDATSTIESHFIASGTSTESSEIIIWEKSIKKAHSTVVSDSNMGRLVTLVNILIVIVVLHWTSSFWMPIASQLARGTLIMANNMVGESAIPQAQPEHTTSNKWLINDEENEDQEQEDVRWRKIQEGYLEKLDEL